MQDTRPGACPDCGVGTHRRAGGARFTAQGRAAVLTLDFTASHDYLDDGEEWRGVRTKTHSCGRWLSGLVQLHDLRADPLQLTHLAASPEHAELASRMESTMRELVREIGDELVPCWTYAPWFDEQRRVVRN